MFLFYIFAYKLWVSILEKLLILFTRTKLDKAENNSHVCAIIFLSSNLIIYFI